MWTIITKWITVKIVIQMKKWWKYTNSKYSGISDHVRGDLT
jgi:hypothetical protein